MFVLPFCQSFLTFDGCLKGRLILRHNSNRQWCESNMPEAILQSSPRWRHFKSGNIDSGWCDGFHLYFAALLLEGVCLCVLLLTPRHTSLDLL